jgi:hypothetical protein
VIDLACHCGGVRLTVLHAPEELLQCNCSICRQSGFLGSYYPVGEVTVTGTLDPYVRSDMDKPCLTMWRCANCGILTHWTLLDEWPYDDIPRPGGMGVNARLFPTAMTDALPVRHNDGASQ